MIILLVAETTIFPESRTAFRGIVVEMFLENVELGLRKSTKNALL